MNKAVRNWFARLPRGWILAASSVLLLGGIVASVGMYRAYDYVQHDNDFCTTCHLMQGPYERFAQSEHRGLGCKACHRPNIWQRSTMGMIQLIERPDSLTRHAEVPTETCAECHVDGKPEEWKLIAQSAGHRAHLESNDPKLAKIECLTCHGAGIHNFATSDQSCGQSGCHENTKIELGGMSKLTIHCAGCHDFNKPLASSVSADSARSSLRPARNDCFSCHEMRSKVASSIPADEPHGAVCGTCHNPHKQETPAAAVTSCASGSCHQQIDTVSAMHRKLGMGVLENCTMCHSAHNWKPKGKECSSCHSPEELDNPTGKPIKRLNTTAKQQTMLDLALAPTRLLLSLLGEPPFRHKLHASVPCKSCHESDDGHGAVKIKTAADCQGCHHSAANRGRCSSCHTKSELDRTFKRTFSWKLSVWKAPQERTLGFTHERHSSAQCQSCHKPEAALRNTTTCTSCHTEHHDAARTCTSCHSNLKNVKQHNAKVHLSCTTAGCHQDKTTATLRTQRNVCLACHSDMAEHQPQGDCATCHMIPKHAKETRR